MNCVECGVTLNKNDVMKLIFEDGSFEIIPFSRCPDCFKKEILKNIPKKTTKT